MINWKTNPSLEIKWKWKRARMMETTSMLLMMGLTKNPRARIMTSKKETRSILTLTSRASEIKPSVTSLKKKTLG